MLTCRDPLPLQPRRVLVAGVSGCGKTTLAQRIAHITGGKHTEIDALFHGPRWTPRPEFLDDVAALVAEDAWTTEWQYTSARPILAEAADLLVWLDLPFWRVTFPRLVRRTLSRRWHRRVLWNGNVEPSLWAAIRDPGYVVRWAVRSRNKYPAKIAALQVDPADLTIVRLRSPSEVDYWLTTSLAQQFPS